MPPILKVTAQSAAVLSLEKLVAFQGAFKRLSEPNYNRLRKQLLENGVTAAFTVWNKKGRYLILDGHQRREALSRMKEEGINIPPLPVTWADVKDEASARRIVLGLASTYGDVDREVVGSFAKEAGLDLSKLDGLFRFHDVDLASMNESIPGATKNRSLGKVIEMPKDVRIKQGEMFALGKHRIFCGDSTNKQDVGRLLKGAKVSVMVTDPPYGVNYDPSWRAKLGMATTGKIANDDRADWTEAWKLFPGAVAYVWHGGLHASVVQSSLEAAGFLMRSQIIWAKQAFAISRGNFHWQHEACWYAVRKGQTANWKGGRKQSTLWQVSSNVGVMKSDEAGNESTGHGSQKPIELFARAIRNNCSKQGGIYDPFVGSGTAIVAAEKEGAVAYGMEIDPAYCELAIRRWEAKTGGKAEKVPG